MIDQISSKNIIENKLIQLLEDLKKQKSNLIKIAQEETCYDLKDLELLFSETILYIESLPSIIDLHKSTLAFENENLKKISNEAKILLEPFGKCLLTIPANAPLPLAIIVPLSFVLAGNEVIVSASSKVKKITELCVLILKNHFDKIKIFIEGTRSAIDTLVDSALIDMIYFTGSSSLLPDLSQRCQKSYIHMIFEGEGNSLAVLDTKLDKVLLEKCAKDIIESCRFSLGRMCSKPTIIYVPEENMEKFCFEINKEIKNSVLSIRLEEAFDSKTYERLNQLSQLENGNGNLNIIKAENIPLITIGDYQEHEVAQEIYGPGMIVIPYSANDDIFERIKKHRHKLQFSIYTSDLKYKIEKHSGYARYNINRLPIAQDARMPWGCFGASGISDTVDFYRKGLKRTIHEF